MNCLNKEKKFSIQTLNTCYYKITSQDGQLIWIEIIFVIHNDVNIYLVFNSLKSWLS